MPLHGYFFGLSSTLGITTLDFGQAELPPTISADSPKNKWPVAWATHIMVGLIGRFRIVIVRISELVGMRRAGT